MEAKLRDLIKAEGQSDGLYLAVYPAKNCRISSGDVLMALIDDNEKVELLCSNSDDDRDLIFCAFSEFSSSEQAYIYDCFAE